MSQDIPKTLHKDNDYWCSRCSKSCNGKVYEYGGDPYDYGEGSYTTSVHQEHLSECCEQVMYDEQDSEGNMSHEISTEFYE